MACHVPREHISLTMTSRDMRFPSLITICPLWGICMRLPEVCVHAYCVLEQLMACHVPREHISLTMTSRDMRFPPCHVHS